LCLTILNHFRQMLVVFTYFVGSEWRKIFQNLCTRNHCHIWSFCGKYKEKKIFLHSKRREYLATGTRGQNISTFFPTLRKQYSISIPYIQNHFRPMLVVFKYFAGSDWRKIFQNPCTRNHCHIWSFCDDMHAYQINQWQCLSCK
jgi:hypothetical protein